MRSAQPHKPNVSRELIQWRRTNSKSPRLGSMSGVVYRCRKRQFMFFCLLGALLLTHTGWTHISDTPMDVLLCSLNNTMPHTHPHADSRTQTHRCPFLLESLFIHPPPPPPQRKGKEKGGRRERRCRIHQQKDYEEKREGVTARPLLGFVTLT